MKIDPLDAAKFSKQEAFALRALQAGIANENQQKLALKWIVEAACRTYHPEFIAEDANGRKTAYASGRRGVGLSIVSILNLSNEALELLFKKQ